MQVFSAHGKFLISGEYFVLYGARALALPLTKKLQHLTVTVSGGKDFCWRAWDTEAHPWLDIILDSELNYRGSDEVGQKTSSLLKYLRTKRPELFVTPLEFQSRLNYPRQWGLGSSSTLIANLAQWAQVDAFELQHRFFGGSGYDVACTKSSSPLIYHREGTIPHLEEVTWAPGFKEHLRFVYLGRKQNSRDAIASLRRYSDAELQQLIPRINACTQALMEATDLRSFMEGVRSHEELVARFLGKVRVKERLFMDFPGEVKSLGAWGGDFVLAVSEQASEAYFRVRGYHTILPWDELTR